MTWKVTLTRRTATVIICGKVRGTDITQSSCAINHVHVVYGHARKTEFKTLIYKIIDVRTCKTLNIKIYLIISNKRM